MSAPLQAQTAPLRFGRFELHPKERRLLVDGEPAHLGGRAFDLLATLAHQPHRLVGKNELLDTVWPGLVVEESNLHTQMSALRKVLGGDIVVTVPGRGYRFVAHTASPAAAAAPAPLPATTPAPPPPGAALPGAVGPLFGREADLGRVEQALQAGGCVTLAGPGGVGKTRLALAAAGRWQARRCWIDLAPLSEGVQVAGALARALGMPLADGEAGPQLARALAGEPALVVLDNAEHLLDAVAALAVELLTALPHLVLLVTSQIALALGAERVLRIEPLAIEAGVLDNGALALLADRIVAADPRVRLDAASWPLLQEICRQLDGLPLALEMAAARVPLLGLKGVRDKLAHRFALLTTGRRQAAPRQRTLHAALDWSFGLLDERERHLFAALGVFAGGFTLDLCVAVVAAEGDAARWDTIDRLAVLADHSLVAVGNEDPPRYRLLETMRAYALEQLAAGGQEAAVRQRHANALIELFAQHAADDAGRALCLPEIDNVREALVWAQAQAPALAAALAAHVTYATTFSAWRGQAHAWIAAQEPLMRSAPGEAFDPALRVLWWNAFARSSIISLSVRKAEIARHARRIAQAHGDTLSRHAAANAMIRALDEPGPELDDACAELIALAEAHPQWPAQTRVVGQAALAMAAYARGDHEGLLAARRSEFAIARCAGLQAAADTAQTNVVAALGALGRHEEALEHARSVLDRIDSMPNANRVWAWDGFIESLLALDRWQEACAAMPRALETGREFDMPMCIPHLATIALKRARHEAAARLLGYALQAFEARGMAIYDATRVRIRQITAECAAALGSERSATLAEEGRSMGDDEAAAAALRD
jgi:predicted ATPase/DNA-binding winged helix-turn-helix (wHTH) protein